MVSVSLVCVVTLATLGFVAMHPTDDRNTKKYTKEYIDSELQKTDLEPALLMEYLTQLMGKDTGKTSNPLCRNEDTVLTSIALQNILNTAKTPFGIFSTYIIPNGLPTIMHSSSLSAYHLLADRATTVPTNIWMNLSPCKACANILMQEYNKTDTKPTIHYAQLHTSSNNDILSAVESIKCLVRLEREGFSVQVWNWSNFRDNYLSHSECVDQVNTELTTMEFVEAFMDLEQIDAFVHELAQHGGSVANTWCSLD